MRAIVVEQFGGPEVLQPASIPVPEPGEGEIRIRVVGAAVNPTDLLFRAGQQVGAMKSTPLPYIPGRDLAGTVDAIGSTTSDRFAIGDRVMAIAQPTSALGGAYADFVVVPEVSAVIAPTGLDLLAASTVLMNALTARLALDALGARPNDVLGLTGAAGMFGGLFLQLAAADGSPVIADAAPADVETLRRLGVRTLVDRGSDFVRQVLSHVPEGLAGLADAGLVGAPVLGAIRDGGDLATLRAPSDVAERGIRQHRISVATAVGRTDLLQTLRDHLAAGTITPRVADVLPAERAQTAHERMAAGGIRGRIVLDFR